MQLFRYRFLFFVAASLWVRGDISADEIWLQNGNHITGKITRMDTGICQIQTNFAGKLNVVAAKIKRIELESPAPLLDSDGKLTQQQVFGEKQDGDPQAPYPIRKVKVLYPDVVDLGEKGRLKGRMNIALKIENDSQQSSEFDADLDLEYRFLRHLYSTQFQMEYDSSERAPTKQDWLSVTQYAYYYQPAYYFSYWYGLKQEKYDGLELRQTTGPGWGIRFETSPRTYSTTEWGVSFNHEDYVEQSTQEFISANWVLNYERMLIEDRLRFYQRHQSAISLEDIDKMLWHSWTGFRVPIFYEFIASIEYEIDYDSKPALREQHTNTTFRIKLGKEW